MDDDQKGFYLTKYLKKESRKAIYVKHDLKVVRLQIFLSLHLRLYVVSPAASCGLKGEPGAVSP